MDGWMDTGLQMGSMVDWAERSLNGLMLFDVRSDVIWIGVCKIVSMSRWLVFDSIV